MLKWHNSDDRPFKASRRHNLGWSTLKRKLLNSERLSLRRKQCQQSSFDQRQQSLKAVYVSVPKKKKKACCQNHELNVSYLSLTHRVIHPENVTLKKKPCSHSHHFDDSTCHPVPDTFTIAPKKQNDSRLNLDKQDLGRSDKTEELDEDEGWFSREASEASDQTSFQVNENLNLPPSIRNTFVIPSS